jgi:hypothetical protein
MVAGIDIGGKKVRWVLWENGRVKASGEEKTPRSRNGFERVIRGLFAEFKKRGVLRVGISMAGVVSGTRHVHNSNLPALENFDFAKLVPRGMYICVDHDARCFALGELRRGVLRGKASGLAIILGTGVGRAFVDHGRVAIIKRFEHGELWERGYQKRVDDIPSRFAVFLAKDLTSLIEEFRPARLVFGGGAFRKSKLFVLLKRALQRHGVRIPIYRSRFRQNGPAIGAALLVAK